MDGDMYGCIGGRVEKEKEKKKKNQAEEWNHRTLTMDSTTRQDTASKGGDKKEMLKKRGIRRKMGNSER